MMKTGRIALMLCLGAVCASAQFGGFGKKKDAKGGPDAVAVMTQGQDLLSYVTIATDNGVIAVETLLSVFPPEKVQKVADLAAKYNELKKTKRTDQNIDAESVQLASQIATEMAQLDSEWQIHLKEKSAAVKKVDARLALVILADSLAATKAPETARAMQSAAQDLKSDPTKTSTMRRMLAIAEVLVIVGKETPQQVSSFKTVRGMTKKIGAAEKIQIAADPSPDKVKDKTTYESSDKAIAE
jgi:hypothetical protein